MQKTGIWSFWLAWKCNAYRCKGERDIEEATSEAAKGLVIFYNNFFSSSYLQILLSQGKRESDFINIGSLSAVCLWFF